MCWTISYGHPPVVQPEEGVTYAAKIDKAEARIDFSRDAHQVERQIRACIPRRLSNMATNASASSPPRSRIMPGRRANCSTSLPDRPGPWRDPSDADPARGQGGDVGGRIAARFRHAHRQPGRRLEPMARFAFTVEFDGRPFMGWQRQAHGPSVQQAIEDIHATTGERAILHAAGRTDAGVHGLAMRAHADVESCWMLFCLMEADNAKLCLYCVLQWC